MAVSAGGPAVPPELLERTGERPSWVSERNKERKGLLVFKSHSHFGFFSMPMSIFTSVSMVLQTKERLFHLVLFQELDEIAEHII